LVHAWRRREEAADRRVATVCCVLANIHRGRNVPPFSVDDFMPRRPLTTAERIAANDAFMAAAKAGLIEP
jgi:hypothetical protein